MSPARNGANHPAQPDAEPDGGTLAAVAGRPSDEQRDADQTMADSDQTASDSDQTAADGDQTVADGDQAASENDQAASDQDQIASDRESSTGADQEDRDKSSRERDDATRSRDEQVQVRLRSASSREAHAEDRDRVAFERDRVAEERDAAARAQDGSYPPEQRAQRIRDRERAATDRAHAARDRKRAASDRVGAAMERTDATGERLRAAADKAKLIASQTDELTHARRRGAGVEQLHREVVRARNAPQPLVVTFVDVDGLKRTNDTDGHAAGDALLRAVAACLLRSVRPHDLVIRYGGDEFVCVLPNATIDQVRARFDDVSAELGAGPVRGSITVGFAELAEGDSAIDLINRADRDLLARRERV